MTRLPRPFVLAPLMLVAACTERTDYDPQPKPAAPAAASATTAAAVSTPSSASGLPALVRKPISFGAGSMSKVECLKVTGNSLVGDNCQSGFAVFGPYAAVAAGSDVTVSFTFKAAEQV